MAEFTRCTLWTRLQRATLSTALSASHLRTEKNLSKPHAEQFLVPAAGAIFSLWIWRRFGLWYAFLAAMIFVIFLPGYWTSSHSAQHVTVAVFYAAGLICVAAVRGIPSPSA